MKYLKLYESFGDSLWIHEGDDIDSICKKYDITDYTINDDDSIDAYCVKIKSNEYLFGISGLEKLPLKFRKVTGYFHCSDNKLTTLEGCPESVEGEFNCYNNKLTSLEGCPRSVGSDFNCSDNEIRTLEGFPVTLGGDFFCSRNPVYQLWNLFRDKDKVELFNDFGITDGEVVILNRLNDFLEMIGKPIVKDIKGLEKEGYKII